VSPPRRKKNWLPFVSLYAQHSNHPTRITHTHDTKEKNTHSHYYLHLKQFHQTVSISLSMHSMSTRISMLTTPDHRVEQSSTNSRKCLSIASTSTDLVFHETKHKSTQQYNRVKLLLRGKAFLVDGSLLRRTKFVTMVLRSPIW